MTKHEKAELMKALSWLAAGLDKELHAGRLEFYIDNLKDLPLADIVQAIKRAAKECKFFPTVSELRDFAGVAVGRVALEDQSALAWDRLRCLSGSSAYNHQALEDPIIKKCFLALGGNSGFGVWDYEKEEPWKRKHFMSLYQAYSRTNQAHLELTHQESQGVLQQLTGRQNGHA